MMANPAVSSSSLNESEVTLLLPQRTGPSLLLGLAWLFAHQPQSVVLILGSNQHRNRVCR